MTISEQAAPPWGRWFVLHDEGAFKVKRIEVFPGKRLSYQKHLKREEHWYVVRGQARITRDGQEYTLEVGGSTDIAREALHRIENVGDDLLVLIEVQRGDYLGEDDIIRIEDDFERMG
ncbi:MAG: phosphomannose isomerase type II C-terminal cupin domain [Syntrophorhabdales bacterium]|jgi:mannose-6-phosphate isomerase